MEGFFTPPLFFQLLFLQLCQKNIYIYRANYKLLFHFFFFSFAIFCSNSVLLFVVSPLLCAIRIRHLAHWSAALTSARPSEDPSLRGCEWGDQTPPRWILAIGSCSCKLTALIRSIATALSSRSVARIAGRFWHLRTRLRAPPTPTPLTVLS